MSEARRRGVVVVTGAGGMGLAVARRLGAGRQLLVAERSPAALRAAAAALSAEGHLVEPVEMDVSSWASVVAVADRAAALGPLDAVIHTAGLSPVMATAEQVLAVDLVGTAYVLDAFLPLATNGTAVVCVASMAGHFMDVPLELARHLATAAAGQLLAHDALDANALDPGTAYSMAKRGNQLRVAAMAAAYGARGARVNSISPGIISTPMGAAELSGQAGEIMRVMLDSSALDRVGTADDIAAVAAFLVGPDSSYVTGTDVLVDGGVVATQRWGRAT